MTDRPGFLRHEGTSRISGRNAFARGIFVGLLGVWLFAMFAWSAGEARAEEADKVAGVRVMGNEKVEAASILRVVYTRKGQTYSEEQVRKDLRRVYKLGYFTDIQFFREKTEEGWLITMVVEERSSIKEVLIEGQDEVSEDDIREVIDVKPYSVLSHAKIERNVEKIRNVYIDKGFFLAEVTYRVDELEEKQANVVFIIKERAKVEVKKVFLVGNHKIKDEDLAEVMLTKPGDFLSFMNNSGQYRQEILERDAFMINQYYADRGYVEAKIGQPKAYISADQRYVTVTFNITEGESFVLGDVGFSGEVIFPPARMRELMRLNKGDVFNRSVFMRDMERIGDAYKDLGYAFANISPHTRLDRKNRIVHVNFQIQKGQKVYVERIYVSGNTSTRDKVIRREMRIDEGDLYSSTAIKRSKQKIYQLGFFETVEIHEHPGSEDNKIELEIEVKERRTGTFQIGFGFSSLESFMFQAQISQNNLMGRGQTLQLNAMIGGRQKQVQFRFIEPYFLDSKFSLDLRLYNQETVYPRQGEFGDYSTGTWGMGLTAGYPVSDEFTLFLGYTVKAENLNVGDNVHLHLFKSGYTSSLTGTVQYDSRDNRLFPTRGILSYFSTEAADDWTGSEIEYLEFYSLLQYFRPVFWKVIFKLNLEMGYVISLEEPVSDLRGEKDFPGVPISQRYQMGGIYSVRGFQYGTISPTTEVISQSDPVGSPLKYRLGGNKKFMTNWELEFPVIEQAGIRWVFFFDAGNVWKEDQQFFYLGQSGQNEWDLPMGLYMSWGWGFRWYSPIGPLRFEWGCPITKRPEDNRIEFEFSIGNQF